MTNISQEPHPLLAQIALTVSPFVSLPTATTLPYTWKPLPSTLPQSSTGDVNGLDKPQYVISASGHAAHPDDIIASCQALLAHLNKMQADAEMTLQKWQNDMKERELAEKRRVAPGWLDREEKILEPVKQRDNYITEVARGVQQMSIMDSQDAGPAHLSLADERATQGAELDRAFGSMGRSVAL